MARQKIFFGPLLKSLPITAIDKANLYEM